MQDPLEVYSIGEIAELVYPPDYRGARYLAVVRGYCDESYDRDNRIYSLAGFIGRDKEWKELSRLWRNRCLRDGIQCYHAADCENAYKEFAGWSKDRIQELNTDLISHVVKFGIRGFGVSTILEDYSSCSNASEKAQRVLGQHPYFIGMQMLVCDIAGEILDNGLTNSVAFIFDQIEQFSGRAKEMYDKVKVANPHFANHMGTLTYADKREFVPLQIADKLAYEVMKNMLNLRHDPERKERISLTRMKKGRVIQVIRYMDRESLEKIVDSQP